MTVVLTHLFKLLSFFPFIFAVFSTLRLYNSILCSKKRLHRPTFDKIDMAYIKTPCPNRNIVKVLKIQQSKFEWSNSRTWTAPVGQKQIHINLINYKHRCMRQFFGES